MRVFWATGAQRDRADIIDYISQDSPLAAIRMDELLLMRLLAWPITRALVKPA